MIGNVSIYPNDSTVANAIVQIEGLESVPISRASVQDDKEAFAKVVWNDASPQANLAISNLPPLSDTQRQLSWQLEHMAAHYLYQTNKQFPPNSHASFGGQHPIAWLAANILSSGSRESLSWWPAQWQHEAHEQVFAACENCASAPEMQLLHQIGDQLSTVVSPDKPSVDLDNELIKDFYYNAIGIRAGNKCLAEAVKQHTHRYPDLNILHIGVGTYSTAKTIINEIDSTFSSYVFAKGPDNFLDEDETWTALRSQNISFKTLDISQDPTAQDFSEQAYDLVIASPSLHTGNSSAVILRNIRKSLKPAGHLFMLEPSWTISPAYFLLLGAIHRRWLSKDRSDPAEDSYATDWKHMLEGMDMVVVIILSTK